MVAINTAMPKRIPSLAFNTILLISLLAYCQGASLFAAMLPDEEVEYLYHSYDGGGIEITGPSLLVRKNIADKASVSAHYYVDEISSASIDVEVLASPYTEERTETSLAVEYFHEQTRLSAAVGQSDENDYNAKVGHFSVSQDFFGGLTTLTLGVSRGADEIRMTDNETFFEEADRRNFRIGLSQILTKKMLINFNLETITDEGYLNNPYRQYRFIDPDNPDDYITRQEIYPNTRTSNAFSTQIKYYLDYRAAIKGNYRFFRDTWDITAHTADVEYIHPLKENWTLATSFRYYQQTEASFYSDLFSSIMPQEFLARDKEMSELSSMAFGFSVSYAFPGTKALLIKGGSITFLAKHLRIDYDNFRDARDRTLVAGEEPLYSLSANVIRLLLNVKY